MLLHLIFAYEKKKLSNDDIFAAESMLERNSSNNARKYILIYIRT